MRIVISTQGMKLDINVLDLDSIICYENGNIDRIKNRVRYDMTYVHNDERISEFWKYIEEEAANVRSLHDKSLNDWTNKTFNKYFSGGWEVRQPIDKPIGYYSCMIAYGLYDNNKKNLSQGECMAVIESGKFYPDKKDKYYIWSYNPEKGQNWSLKT